LPGDSAGSLTVAADKPLTVTGNFTVNNEGAVTLAGTLVVVGNVAVEAANGLSVSGENIAILGKVSGVGADAVNKAAADSKVSIVTGTISASDLSGKNTVYISGDTTISGALKVDGAVTVSGTLDTPGGTISGAGSITLESGAGSTGQCVWGNETVTLVYKAGSKATVDSATYLGSDSGALYKVEGATVAITKTTWGISGGGTVTANTYTGLGGDEYNLQSITVGAGSTLEVAAEKELRVATGGTLTFAGTLSVEGTFTFAGSLTGLQNVSGDGTVKVAGAESIYGNISGGTIDVIADTISGVTTYTVSATGAAFSYESGEVFSLNGTRTLIAKDPASVTLNLYIGGTWKAAQVVTGTIQKDFAVHFDFAEGALANKNSLIDTILGVESTNIGEWNHATATYGDSGWKVEGSN